MSVFTFLYEKAISSSISVGPFCVRRLFLLIIIHPIYCANEEQQFPVLLTGKKAHRTRPVGAADADTRHPPPYGEEMTRSEWKMNWYRLIEAADEMIVITNWEFREAESQSMYVRCSTAFEYRNSNVQTIHI